jgi:hypothetical protein
VNEGSPFVAGVWVRYVWKREKDKGWPEVPGVLLVLMRCWL